MATSDAEIKDAINQVVYRLIRAQDLHSFAVGKEASVVVTKVKLDAAWADYHAVVDGLLTRIER